MVAALRAVPGPVVLIGAVASGKTTVGRLLSVELCWPVLSFGAYVRVQASRRGIALDREQLERLGSHLIGTRGHDAFLRDVLAERVSGEAFILEGVRHVDMLRAVKRAYRSAVSVYLKVPAEVRYQRWRLREGLADTPDCGAAFDRIAEGEVERYVDSLQWSVDLVADGLGPAERLAEDILNFLAGRNDIPRV